MMDYASRLNAIDTGSRSIAPGTASALAGDYAAFLPGMDGADQGGGGFNLQLAANAPVTPEQRSIIDLMMSAFNNAPRAT